MHPIIKMMPATSRCEPDGVFQRRRNSKDAGFRREQVNPVNLPVCRAFRCQAHSLRVRKKGVRAEPLVVLTSINRSLPAGLNDRTS